MNLGFDLRTLQVFASVVELQSVTRAAERHHIAVSAVSKRVSDLELTLGSPLLRRLPRGVEPTSAGLTLYHHARKMLAQAEQMLGELADFAQDARGYVRLLANKSCIMQFLPQDLSSFFARHPGIRVELIEDNSPGILRGVTEGTAEIGVFAHGSANDSGLQTFDYRSDEMVVLVRADHPLASLDTTTFAEALRYDLIGLDAITTWNSMLGIEADRVGKVLNLRYRVTSFDAIGRMVVAGLGIALTPRGLLEAIPDPVLRGVRLAEPWACRRHMLAVRDRRLLAAPARVLLDHLARSRTVAPAQDSGLLGPDTPFAG